MRQTERQPKLMEVLYQRRSDTMENLAEEFGVSVRTIQRDLVDTAMVGSLGAVATAAVSTSWKDAALTGNI